MPNVWKVATVMKNWYPDCTEWSLHLINTGKGPFSMSLFDQVESYVLHRRLAGDPVVNVKATMFFLYVFLTFWINLFSEWSWDFLKYGVW